MSRIERTHGNKSIAFGVDNTLQPGVPRTFVQVWDTSEDEEPCNEGPDGFNNLLVDEWDVPEERVIKLARIHGIPLDPQEVYGTFD